MLLVCAVCRGPCVLGDLSLLPCGHGLHRDCAILLKSSCPKCSNRTHRALVIDRIYLDGEQPAEKKKAQRSDECGKSEKAGLIDAVLQNRERYQSKTSEQNEELLGFEKKIKDVGERLKTTKKTLGSIVSLEKEWDTLNAEMREAKKENHRLRRLLKISEEEQIMNGCCGTNGDRNALLCTLNVLARQYAHLKKKQAKTIKFRLQLTGKLALAKRESSFPGANPNRSIKQTTVTAIDCDELD
ncbi:hypothetical protein TTRE_0000801001 [Trichuris trichiura]|uniref:RING-type domain-containing protein n=1 Tax=Trichuris trichiura TaxID=36087 RepID=A0A077ZH66_TRITR|nr:hypothetical protein TTRE_0000801001 [Trichuris trichiura]